MPVVALLTALLLVLVAMGAIVAVFARTFATAMAEGPHVGVAKMARLGGATLMIGGSLVFLYYGVLGGIGLVLFDGPALTWRLLQIALLAVAPFAAAVSGLALWFGLRRGYVGAWLSVGAGAAYAGAMLVWQNGLVRASGSAGILGVIVLTVLIAAACLAAPSARRGLV